MRAFYAEPGLNAETYDARAALDLDNPALDGDVAFYLEEAGRTGGPVLDLGGGTGRVSVPLAAAGIDVVLLDLSEAMLAVAERKRAAAPPEVARRLRTVRADMTSFDLEDRFALAIMPFRAFQALLTPDAQRACLASVRSHLRPGGVLVVDVFDPRLDLCVPGVAPDPQRAVGETIRHPLNDHEVEIRVLSRANDPLAQLLEERWRFTERDAGGVTVREEEEILRMRWTYRHEMRYLLELAGFEVRAEYGDFHGSPPAYAREQVWVAERSGD